MVASESNYRFGEIDKILTTQNKVNNNMVMLIKKMQKEIDENWRRLEYYLATIKAFNKRIKKLEKENEIDLETIKLGGTDG